MKVRSSTFVVARPGGRARRRSRGVAGGLEEFRGGEASWRKKGGNQEVERKRKK